MTSSAATIPRTATSARHPSASAPSTTTTSSSATKSASTSSGSATTASKAPTPSPRPTSSPPPSSKTSRPPSNNSPPSPTTSNPPPTLTDCQSVSACPWHNPQVNRLQTNSREYARTRRTSLQSAPADFVAAGPQARFQSPAGPPAALARCHLPPPIGIPVPIP